MHELPPDLLLPGHWGNFELSASDRSTPQHMERYKPWTRLISQDLCMTALLGEQYRRTIVADGNGSPLPICIRLRLRSIG